MSSEMICWGSFTLGCIVTAIVLVIGGLILC